MKTNFIHYSFDQHKLLILQLFFIQYFRCKEKKSIQKWYLIPIVGCLIRSSHTEEVGMALGNHKQHSHDRRMYRSRRYDTMAGH